MVGYRESNGLRSFSQLIRPWGGQLTFVVILVGLLALADMALPCALALLIDDAFPALADGSGWELLWIILGSLCAIYVLRNFLFYISRMISVRVSEEVCFDLRQRLFNHMQKLGLGFYKSKKPGEVSSRVMDDTFRIQVFIQDKLPILLRYIIEFQVLIILLYLVNWKLALASTVVLPFHLWIYKKFYLPIRQSHLRAQEHIAEAHGNLVESFLGAQVVKGFSAEKRETETFIQSIRAGRDDQITTQKFQFAQKVVADLLVGLGTVMLLGYGAWEVYTGSMTIGLFLMFFWYVRMLYPAVIEVISGTGHFSRTSASVDRVLEMLDEPIDDITFDMRTRSHEISIIGPIEFNDVSFEYEANTPVLKNINLQIDPGEHLAITGPSGSGKSTLISLLPRFNNPTSGEITVSGHNITDMRMQDIRGMFGFAFQEVFLFKASILDNLLYAKPTASIQTIIKACKLTGAHSFIERLPDGYETEIGGHGVELSHGQKQRINLARALIRDTQALVIDETTASIDSETSQKIIRSVLEQMLGRTVIIVTHDPTILNLVQRVVTLGNKTIINDENNNPRYMKHPAVKLGALLVSASMFLGCSTTSTTRMIEMEEPKSTGIVFESKAETSFADLAKAIDEVVGEPSIITYSQEAIQPLPPNEISPEEIAELIPEQEVGTNNSNHVYLPLESMNQTEIEELIELIAQKYESQGYSNSSNVLDGVLEIPPDGVVEHLSIAKKQLDTTHIIRIGYKMYLSQPPHLWCDSFLITGSVVSANSDVELLQQFVTETLESLNSKRDSLTLGDLGSEVIQLSYIDAPTAIELLRGYGVTIYPIPSEIPLEIDWNLLPYVVLIPEPATEHTGLVGGSVTGGAFGMSMTPNAASSLSTNMISSPTTQLIVFFDESNPEHFSEISRLLELYIDRPARQIFVEGMVLEINEDGLKDLGIDWNLTNTPNGITTINAGQLNAGTDNDTFGATLAGIDLSRPFSNASDWLLGLQLRALLQDGKAEILSRPSVLTLNNRQSTIRVGQDIPIATSTSGITNADTLAFSFTYLPTGIMLNIRPRISADGSEVSMLIDTVVSSTVPGADLEIRDLNDQLLASAPTISSRRVQTYGRIPNNTPFIIGGLVNKEHHTILDRVPLLSDIPLIGGLFQSERTTSSKTEVIIVLIPHVLPENDSVMSAMPKDDPRFDNAESELFRDSYRIRQDDVFDLAFLEKNEPLQMYRKIARDIIAQNYTYKNNPAFAKFAKGHFPGESILVTRMVYEIIKRLNLADPIPTSRLAFFRSENGEGMGVEFLDQAIARSAGVSDPNDFFADDLQKAFIITFEEGRAVPFIQTVHCSSENEWKEILTATNQETSSGAKRHSIVIHNAKDLMRLRRSVALKDLVVLNNGSDSLALDQFHVGQYILVPEEDPKQVHIIDADVAKYFYHTEHYYAATLKEIQKAINDLELELSKIKPSN
jgi:ABC-type multidrug transport system fused ATPase/permease subunit/Flp pilus assembly secretin CpaC